MQYKGFIVKEIASEFEVSMKRHFSMKQSLGEWELLILCLQKILIYTDLNTVAILGKGAEGEVFKCISQKGAHKCAIKRYNSKK